MSSNPAFVIHFPFELNILLRLMIEAGELSVQSLSHMISAKIFIF